MTPAGYSALNEEIRHLKSVERPAVVKAIEEARAHGDLSENAEYDAAKDKQAFVEGRIREVETKLAQAEVIDVSNLSGDRIVFGATVTIFDHEKEQEKTWTIVGDEESDLKKKQIGISSPIARALIGKSEGDEVDIHTPGGIVSYEIIQVSFHT